MFLVQLTFSFLEKVLYFLTISQQVYKIVSIAWTTSATFSTLTRTQTTDFKTEKSSQRVTELKKDLTDIWGSDDRAVSSAVVFMVAKTKDEVYDFKERPY